LKLSETVYKIVLQKLTKVFPHILWCDVENAFQSIDRIEKSIIGRHCGDFGDKLCQYLSICELVRANCLSSINGIEIGVLFGGSCLNKLSAMRDLGVGGKIVCIDPLDGYYGEKTDKISGRPVTPDTFFENLRRLDFEPNLVELRRCFSNAPEAYAGLQDSSFDHLMIDGGHLYEDVKTDWQVFHPYVAPNGHIIIDDYYDHAWPDITRFASEMILTLPNEWKAAGHLGTTLILQHGIGDGSDAMAICPTQSISENGESMRLALFDLFIGEARSAAWNRRVELLKSSMMGAFEIEGISSQKQSEGLSILIDLHQYLKFPLTDLVSILSTIESPAAIMKWSQITTEPSIRYHAYRRLLNVPEYAFEANRKLGTIEYQQKNWKPAFEYLSAAIRLGPDVSSLYVSASECAANLSDWPTVIDCCRKGLLLNAISSAERFRLQCRLGNALIHISDYDGAESCFNAALSIPELSNENLYHARYHLGRCLAQAGKYQTSVDVTKSALQTADIDGNKRISCLVQIGLSQYAMKEYHQAQLNFEAVLSESPENPDAVYTSKMYLGYCLVGLSKFAEALPVFFGAYADETRSESERFEAASGIVTVLSNAGDFKQIREFVTSVVSDTAISIALRNAIVQKIKTTMALLKGGK
jgi:tetratricopeptide (TPR) repeat protein